MNDRQRWLATMRYQTRDRPPLCEFSYWPETLQAWRQQGMPADVYWNGYDDNSTEAFFGFDSYRKYVPVETFLCPEFEEKVIEDRGDTELAQQADGVRVIRSKRMGSIPRHEAHLLVDRQSWRRHYRPRLDPEDPARIPGNMGQRPSAWSDADRKFPLVVRAGSLWGMLRNWMGLEGISLVVHDDAALFEEMVVTMADCAVGLLGRLFEMGVKLDACYLWEDMCFNGGPLINPSVFKRYLVPQYRRIADRCRSHGVDIICLDCDGKIDTLIPLWLQSGINVLYPIEIGTCGNDPIELRKRFGKELRMMGGFDKRVLAGTKSGIDKEVARLAPLVDEGGFIGFCDHYVPPDVPLDNYLHFAQTIRHVWGQDANLKSARPF
jgi:uroporphyrinogen decarboxylase